MLRDILKKVNLKLSDPVTKLSFVGETYAKRLGRLEIKTVRDLLYHFPFRYQDFRQTKKIRDLMAHDEVAITGEIIKTGVVHTKTGKLLTKAAIADETGAIEAVWFNQPYLTRTLKVGIKAGFAGKVEPFGGKLAFVSPEFEIIKEGQTPTHTEGLVPIYPETSRVSSKWLRARIKNALQVIPVEDPQLEFIPEGILRNRRLFPWGKSLRTIHFPATEGEAQKARTRFAFEELLLFNLRSLKRRKEWDAKRLTQKINIRNNREKIKRFISDLPFALTEAQKRAVGDILNDLDKPTPMNRLLEGDVGSGKTVVAAIATYACFLNGSRTILMAPTEILAEQHFKTLKSFLEPCGIKCVLRTGSRKPDNRTTGQLDYHLWIGTHALFYRKGGFKNVGLIIIDEQHRFGVEQRAKLVKISGGTLRNVVGGTPHNKVGGTPHILTLTATPIPRSLALTVYGDLDLSVIDELPPGRKRIKTFVVPNEKREAGYRWIKERVKRSDQAFIICPLIEESEKETMQQVKAATAEYEKLRLGVFSDLSLGLLHGKLKAKEKEEVVDRFREGKDQILVSTPVVEVGIDIPAATIMVIEAAERFGLASLHQLRGRVGRGDKESYCFLFTEGGSRDVFRRLKALESTASGFELAELDLKLRGPGELYGIKQHGLTEMKVADLSDTRMLKDAQESAREIISRGLTSELKEVLKYFASALVEPN